MKDKIYDSVRQKALLNPEIRVAAHFADSAISSANSVADRVSSIALEVFHSEPVSIDQLASNMSTYADRIILSGKQEGLIFLGGYLYANFDLKDEQNFLLDLKVYFKDGLGKNVLKESSKVIPLEYLDEQSQSDIKTKLKLTYPIIEHN